MLLAARQVVTVQVNCQIVLRAPQFQPGTQVEVIVLEQPPATADDLGPPVPLRSLIGSCKGMFKSADEADEFIRKERESWDR
jgi:hypothetical protein